VANHQAQAKNPASGMHWFGALSANFARWAGSPVTFALAMALLVAWALSGPYFGFSDTWQLVINTATSIVTFLIVFLIQNTQNRDARAIHLKLDEIIRSIKRAENEMINIERLSDEELAELTERYDRIRCEAEKRRVQQKAG